MRKASALDIEIAKEVEDYKNRFDISHAVAVRDVAQIHGYKVKTVYKHISRSKVTTDSTDKTDAPQPIFPEGQALKGVSSFVDGDGNIIRQWIKTDKEQSSWQRLIDVALLKASHLAPLPPMGEPQRHDSGLAVYPVADWHVGLYANPDWTLETALSVYNDAFTRLVRSTPATETALLVFMGDFTHNDNASNTTPRSGKQLDVSARYDEIVEAALQMVVDMVQYVAGHHTNVEVVYLSGNHDEATGVVMQAALSQLFKATKRVHVWKSGRMFYYRHNLNLLGFTHGHTVKREALPLLMATDEPYGWGITTNRVWHTGHVHHQTVQEFTGCTVESHSSPAPKDKWHEDSGYRSRRSMQSITYNNVGEVMRAKVNL